MSVVFFSGAVSVPPTVRLSCYAAEAGHEAILNSMVFAKEARGLVGEMYYSLAECLKTKDPEKWD